MPWPLASLLHLHLHLLPLLAWSLLQGVPASAQQVQLGEAVPDFAALDQTGRQHQLSAQADVPVVVLYAYATGCPIARQDLLTLALQQTANPQLRIMLLDSTPEDEREAIRAELAELKVDLPVLLDPAQALARRLGIDRTGEALVITTADRRLRWRGPVDDRLGYGAQRAVASHAYLQDAVSAAIAGAPSPPAPPAKGCRLAFSDQDRRYDYAADIAPILSRRCLQCHCEGGVAPFAMSRLKSVLKHRAMIEETVLTRRMPPWQADPAVGSFQGAAGLTVDEQRALLQWIAQGSPHLESRDPLAQAHPAPAQWPLGPPDLIVDCPQQAIPASGVLPYRRFEIALSLPKDVWVGGYDLHPSDARVMHHAFAFLVRPGEAVNPRALRFTGLDDFFANYVPGCPAAMLPAGTGKLLPQGSRLAFQVHYTTCGEAVTDHPRLGLYFLHQPPAREIKVASARRIEFVIPPGAADVPVQAAWTTLRPIILYGMAPHMHLRGSWMRYEAQFPDGHRQDLLSVPRYDVNWQWLYRPTTPISLPAGTRILVSGGFDNSRFNELNPDPTRTVRWGEQTWNEMFIGYLQYAEP